MEIQFTKTSGPSCSNHDKPNHYLTTFFKSK